MRDDGTRLLTVTVLPDGLQDGTHIHNRLSDTVPESVCRFCISLEQAFGHSRMRVML